MIYTTPHCSRRRTLLSLVTAVISLTTAPFKPKAFHVTTTSAPKVTRPQHERIEMLKRELLGRVKGDLDTRSDILNYGVYDTYEDSHSKDFVVEPIYPDDGWKKLRVKKPANRTSLVTTLKPTRNRSAKRQGLRSVLKPLPMDRKKEHLLNPLDIFYRRVVGEEMKDMETKWVHCQDLISPYLTGIKKDPSVLQKVSIKDAVVVRFLHLMKTNTTDYNKDEVKSVLYQISKLKLRLFQWDVMPIRALLTTLIKGGAHTFRNLKKGIREQFETWRLSLYNATKLLQAARIIRPPCTITSQYSGSTKSQKVSRFKDWITTPKPLCDHSSPDNDDEDCL